MSQDQVLGFLKAHPKKWFNSNQIMEGMGNIQGLGSLGVNLLKLRSDAFVESRGTNRRYEYRHKVR